MRFNIGKIKHHLPKEILLIVNLTPFFKIARFGFLKRTQEVKNQKFDIDENQHFYQ